MDEGGQRGPRLSGLFPSLLLGCAWWWRGLMERDVTGRHANLPSFGSTLEPGFWIARA